MLVTTLKCSNAVFPAIKCTFLFTYLDFLRIPVPVFDRAWCTNGSQKMLTKAVNINDHLWLRVAGNKKKWQKISIALFWRSSKSISKFINCYYIVILCKFLLTEVVRVNQTNLFTIGLRIRAWLKRKLK